MAAYDGNCTHRYVGDDGQCWGCGTMFTPRTRALSPQPCDDCGAKAEPAEMHSGVSCTLHGTPRKIYYCDTCFRKRE